MRLESNKEVSKLSARNFTQGNLVKQLLMKEGDRVQAAQIIAIIDSRDRLQASLLEAQSHPQPSC